MLDLQTLRAFVAVAREGSVSRAAERLHLTQPAVSLKLKQMQDRLAMRLFKRNPHGLTLTADGRRLLPMAERALAAMATFERNAQSLNSSLRGKLRIGTIIDPEFIRLGPLLHELVASAPQVETELHHATSGIALQRLLKDELDFGYYLDEPGDAASDQPSELAAHKVRHRELTRFQYFLVAPRGWEKEVAAADWRHLVRLPWITTPPESVHHRLLKRVLQPRNLAPKSVAQVDQESSMLELVRAGMGLSLARDTVALAEKQKHGLLVVPGIALPCALSVIWKEDQTEDAIIQLMHSLLDRVWGAGRRESGVL
ncbi:MAG: LysR family transcriptional regulator [Natronospirillum sp.]|uniref:LysR family transcriptional regulator n=1 Tax=Natronospirillum sp. TaxID=2812955 RepID=UPI0025FBD848|nr:LysR family transcriptional regulator [Natronospirillum sp.]MCH8551458.1 LysR family transcriptional regulator [Natronospirillum sp.]